MGDSAALMPQGISAQIPISQWLKAAGKGLVNILVLPDNQPDSNRKSLGKELQVPTIRSQWGSESKRIQVRPWNCPLHRSFPLYKRWGEFLPHRVASVLLNCKLQGLLLMTWRPWVAVKVKGDGVGQTNSWHRVGPQYESTPSPLNNCFSISGGSDGKESACNVPLGGETSPEEGNGNPLQYSCLENSTDRGALGYSPWGHKESDMTFTFTLWRTYLVPCTISMLPTPTMQY